ncbi:MAG TPA: xanthine dehydrogenase accessory protein XdhC, partial [Telluria sp.]|nr:xanthine dehydrogenase accessory protein XdhC [Telluria sp.]
MNEWLTAMAAGPAVLVTVAAVEGSAPREPGARMLVGPAQAHGTIGGGHLELRAIEIARAMLAGGRERHLERFALGPSLGQCCGGVVHLAFERTDAGHASEIVQACWRLVALDGPPARFVIPAQAGTPALGAKWERNAPAVPASARMTGPVRAERDGGAPAVPASAVMTCLLTGADGRRWLADLVEPPRAHLVLFGAGHVGAALVRALGPLPCTVTWVDEREDLFPAGVPTNVTVEATDTPEAAVADAPSGAAFLVMT